MQLQDGRRTRTVRRDQRESSLHITGGRTCIRTTDLFLVSWRQERANERAAPAVDFVVAAHPVALFRHGTVDYGFLDEAGRRVTLREVVANNRRAIARVAPRDDQGDYVVALADQRRVAKTQKTVERRNEAPISPPRPRPPAGGPRRVPGTSCLGSTGTGKGGCLT